MVLAAIHGVVAYWEACALGAIHQVKHPDTPVGTACVQRRTANQPPVRPVSHESACEPVQNGLPAAVCEQAQKVCLLWALYAVVKAEVLRVNGTEEQHSIDHFSPPPSPRHTPGRYVN